MKIVDFNRAFAQSYPFITLTSQNKIIFSLNRLLRITKYSALYDVAYSRCKLYGYSFVYVKDLESAEISHTHLSVNIMKTRHMSHWFT